MGPRRQLAASRGWYAAFFFGQRLYASVAFLTLHAGSTHLITIDVTDAHAVSAVVLWVVQLASSPCACVPVKSSTIEIVTQLFLFEVPRTRLAVGAWRRRDVATPEPPARLTPDAARLRTNRPLAPMADHAVVRTWNMTRLFLVGLGRFQSSALLVLHHLPRQHVLYAFHGSRLNPIPARTPASLGRAVGERRRVPKITRRIRALLRFFRARTFGHALFRLLNDAAYARAIPATVLLIPVDANLRLALAPLTPLAYDALVGAEDGAVALGFRFFPRAFFVVDGSAARFIHAKHGAKLTTAPAHEIVKGGPIIIIPFRLFIIRFLLRGR